MNPQLESANAPTEPANARTARGIRLRRALYYTALVAPILLIFSTGLGIWQTSRMATPEPAPTGVANSSTLLAAYDRWASEIEGTEAERWLVLPLARNKGLSTIESRAAGQLRLDLATGDFEARVARLDREGRYSVWLLDNQPGEGRSVRAEPGDRLLRLGDLVEGDDGHALEARIDPATVAGMKLDWVIVARDDEGPLAGGVLFGSPSLFQRMYHGIIEPSDPTKASLALQWLVPQSAMAALPPRPPRDRDRRPRRGGGGGAPVETLLEKGERLFFDETFAGNGRTCGSCHPAENNFTIDAAWLARLPDDDPAFVHEFDPALAELENAVLFRTLALVTENVDGFDRPGVLRSVPHTLALATSRNPAPPGLDGSDPAMAPFERLGWGGDGAPNGGTLRDFAVGAVIQHFPKRLDRVEGIDFRLPTDDELDAMEAFQLSLGRSEDPDLSQLALKSPLAQRGLELFAAETTQPVPGSEQAAGRCGSCHFNGGANASPLLLSTHGAPQGTFNLNLEIAVNEPPEPTGEMVDPGGNPLDRGFGQDPHPLGGFGQNTFNVPSLVEAADTAPMFHDNSSLTLEGAIQFYLGGEFNGSPGADLIAAIDDPPGFGVLSAAHSQTAAIAVFLRVLNSLENIRSAIAYLDQIEKVRDPKMHSRRLGAAIADLEDGWKVLEAVDVHPYAIEDLKDAIYWAERSGGKSRYSIQKAVAYARDARSRMVE